MIRETLLRSLPGHPPGTRLGRRGVKDAPHLSHRDLGIPITAHPPGAGGEKSPPRVAYAAAGQSPGRTPMPWSLDAHPIAADHAIGHVRAFQAVL